jgi:hypothetical protein
MEKFKPKLAQILRGITDDEDLQSGAYVAITEALSDSSA